MPEQAILIIFNVLMLLAAVVGFVMVPQMRPPAPRLLAIVGLALVAGHAVWSLLEHSFLWSADLGIPYVVLDVLSWANYGVLLVGLLLLVLAATKRSGPATSAPSRGYAPYQPAPHQPPAEPPPMPPPSGAGPRP